MRSSLAAFALAAVTIAALAQTRTTPTPEEQQALMRAVSEGQNSSVDMLRALEGFLAKFPDSPQKPELYKSMTRAAIDLKDDAKVVKYGVPALESALSDPSLDPLLLDRVARSLLALGGKANADQALKFARTYEDLISGLDPATGTDAARRQDDRERAIGRAISYQAQARHILGQIEDATRTAARAFAAYPSEETARGWSEALAVEGRKQEALARLADAFSIPDPYVLPVQRQLDRQKLGELYEQLHAGSQTGLGDLLLEAYDRMTTVVETRLQRLAALDPNSVAKSPLEATITSIDGKKLSLATLKGKVVVMDFWATWCVPCRAQHPLYEEVKKKFGPREDLVFLTINADEDHTLVEPFLEESQWDRNIYFEDGLARMLAVNSIPTTVLYGKNGLIASRMTGFEPNSFADQLTERIKDALGN